MFEVRRTLGHLAVRALVVVAVLGGVLLVGDSTAHAGKLGAFTTPIDDQIVVDCADHDVLVHWFGTIQITDYPNQTRQLRADISGTFTDLVTGETLHSYTPWKLTISFQTEPYYHEIWTYTGVRLRVAKPGEGLLTLDSGRLTFNNTTGETLVDAGPSGLLDACALF